MYIKPRLLLLLILIVVALFVYKFVDKKPLVSNLMSNTELDIGSMIENSDKNKYADNPMSIEYGRNKVYPGSEIVVEQTLATKPTYNQYIVSYLSEGNKIYALMSVPKGNMPEGGWPAIIFNHGYIPPEQYRTNEKYVAYFDNFARNGYVVFKSDYRGHGSSEGTPSGAYYSDAYTTDVLNGFISVKNYENVNPDKIGMWGHSMGGYIAMRSMVIRDDIKAGVIWGGVVGSYQEMANDWHRSRPWRPSEREQQTQRPRRQSFIDMYGDFNANPEFWNAISPTSYLNDISGPIQLHHGTADDVVPISFSQSLYNRLTDLDKEAEIYEYPGGDHNLSGASYSPAARRSLEFFDKYLKT